MTNERPSERNFDGRVSVCINWCFTAFCAKLRVESTDFVHLKGDESLTPIMQFLIEGINNRAAFVKTAGDCSADLNKWLSEVKGKFTSIDL